MRTDSSGHSMRIFDGHAGIDLNVQLDVVLEACLPRVALLRSSHAIDDRRRTPYCFDRCRLRHSVDQIHRGFAQDSEAGIDYEKANRKTAVVVGGKVSRRVHEGKTECHQSGQC